MGEVINVISAGRVVAVNGHKRSVHVEYHVDTCRVEDARTLIVVRVRIEVVHADGVDLHVAVSTSVRGSGIGSAYTEQLEQCSISYAGCSIAQDIRIGAGIKGGRSSRLVAGIYQQLCIPKFFSLSPYSTPMIITLSLVTESTNS